MKPRENFNLKEGIVIYFDTSNASFWTYVRRCQIKTPSYSSRQSTPLYPIVPVVNWE